VHFSVILASPQRSQMGSIGLLLWDAHVHSLS
jgi:hypothetical protein